MWTDLKSNNSNVFYEMYLLELDSSFPFLTNKRCWSQQASLLFCTYCRWRPSDVSDDRWAAVVSDSSPSVCSSALSLCLLVYCVFKLGAQLYLNFVTKKKHWVACSQIPDLISHQLGTCWRCTVTSKVLLFHSHFFFFRHFVCLWSILRETEFHERGIF